MTNNNQGLDPYIQNQIQAKSRPAVTKIRYLDFRSKYPHGLLLAVEGNDDKVVYSYWIARVAPDLRFEFFVCGGKRGVRQLRNSLALDQSGADQDVAFLVDRDFDDLAGFLSEDRVFMLDRYSVENYLLDSTIIDGVIREAFPGSGDPSSRAAICRMFEADYDEFLACSREVNRRIFIARKLSINIDDTIPSSLTHIASVNLGKVRPCGIPAEQSVPYPEEPKADLIEHHSREFDTLDPRSRYRGKFSYKFLTKWLGLLLEEFKRPALNLFPLRDDGEGRVKPDELSLGSLAFRSSLPCGFDAFFRSLESVKGQNESLPLQADIAGVN